EAFQRAELDVEALPAEEVAERIRRSSVTVELATMLDHWAVTRLKIRGRTDPSWKHLLCVARAADSDTWRGHLRDALEQANKQALLDLVVSGEALQQPPLTLYVLCNFLQVRGAVEQVEALLRQAWQRHQGDFWANEELAFALGDARPPRWEEAIGFSRAAVALRPQSPGAHLGLG